MYEVTGITRATGARESFAIATLRIAPAIVRWSAKI